MRVKVVKNKVAPPFKQAEFDIIYGDGISWEGSVLDVALERKLVQKSGSYFSYGDERLGQGRQNATAFLREHPDVTEQILRAIQAQLGARRRRLVASPADERRSRREAGEGGEEGRPKGAEKSRRTPARPRGVEVSTVSKAVATLTALRRAGPGRVALELDGRPWRTVPDDVVVRCGLHAGLALDRARLRSSRTELQRAEALATAGRALARARCRAGDWASASAVAVSGPRRSARPSPRWPRPASWTTHVSRSARAEGLAGTWVGRPRRGSARLEREGFGRGGAGGALRRSRRRRHEPRPGEELGKARAKTWGALARRGFAPEAIEDALGALDAEEERG